MNASSFRIKLTKILKEVQVRRRRCAQKIFMRRINGLLVIVLCVAGLCIVGCNSRLSPEAEKLLASGKLAYNNGDDRGVVRKMDVFLKDNDRSRRSDEAYYYRGLARYRMGNLPGAKADMRESLDRTRHKSVRVGALVALGDLAYDMDDVAAAERMYSDALKELGDDKHGKKPADHAHYRLGTVLQRRGRWDEADAHFDRVIYLFKDSELAKRSALRVRCRAWTIQAGIFKAKLRADAAMAEMRAKNLPADRRPVLRDGRLVFRVSIGRYPTFEQAKTSMAAVKRHYGDAFITTTR